MSATGANSRANLSTPPGTVTLPNPAQPEPVEGHAPRRAPARPGPMRHRLPNLANGQAFASFFDIID